MNYDENLTYDWLRELRQKRIKVLKEDEPKNPVAPSNPQQQEVPSEIAQAIANRALVAYQNKQNWYYSMKSAEEAKPSPSISPAQGHGCDCTGFVVWAWGLRGSFTGNSTRVGNPNLGYGIWYDQKLPDTPQKKYYGHGGVIVKVYPDGDFDSVDCSYSQGTLRYVKRAKSWWQAAASGKEVEFWRPNNVPPSITDTDYSASTFGGSSFLGGDSEGVSFGDRTEYSPFKTFLKSLVTESYSTNEEKILDKNKEKKFKIINKSKHKDIKKNKDLLVDMLSYFGKKLKFDKPVRIVFTDDEPNSNKPLGKTAYYHPEEQEITVFTTGRLLKDILRSVGHELIHHRQHCEQPFDMSNHQEGYAQKDENMRKKEKEAYLYGNILFRDWEDNYKKKHKGVS